MLKRLRCVFALLLFVAGFGLTTSNLFASQVNDVVPRLVAQQIPNAQLVGRGELNYLVWDVYLAELYAPEGHYDAGKPFALRLVYRRHFDGPSIADGSVSEMERQGFNDKVRLETWHRQMENIFPDVDPDTVLIGVSRPGKPTCFYRDDAALGCITDPTFSDTFFKIWLGEDTRDNSLRQSLLGEQ